MRGLLGEGESRGCCCLERRLLVVVAWSGRASSEEEIGVYCLLLARWLKRDVLGRMDRIGIRPQKAEIEPITIALLDWLNG